MTFSPLFQASKLHGQPVSNYSELAFQLSGVVPPVITLLAAFTCLYNYKLTDVLEYVPDYVI